uniref:UBA domain-containing protein n=1 Tax=Taenia asiatica TaxID=60517 RepID=A0A0R3WDM3_TAEAS
LFFLPDKTTVSKCFIVAVVTTSAFVHISGGTYRSLFIYDTDAIFSKHEVKLHKLHKFSDFITRLLGRMRLWFSKSLSNAFSTYLGFFQLAGLVCRWKNLQKVNLIPFRVAEMFSRLLGPFLSSEAPDDALKSIGATLELQRQEALDRQEQALMDLRRIQFVNSNRRRNYVPQPHEIQNLVDMGFPEERSHLALTVAHGDIYEAINLLQDPSFDLH